MAEYGARGRAGRGMQERDVDRISAGSVKTALRAIRYAKEMEEDPLLELLLVQRSLREEGVSDGAGNRAWMLGRCLDDLIRRRLAVLRGQDADPLPPRPDAGAEMAAIEEDYRRGSLDLEAWSMLYIRYLGLSQPTGAELADRLGITTKTITRRLERGHRLLADHLSELELAARRDADRMPGVAVPERIRVDAPDDAADDFPDDAADSATVGAAASTPDADEVDAEAVGALRDLLAAIRSEDRALHLSGARAAAIERHRPRSLAELQLARVAEWSRPRYRLDSRFVGLTLLLDMGERALSGRWQAQDRTYDGLGALLDDQDAPALALLGPPGSGKSTLLRRMELDACVQALRGETERVCFLQSLSQYRPARPGGPAPEPGAWLAERWAASGDALEPLDELLRQGCVLLLLDALNEMPAASQAELTTSIRLWKDWLHGLVARHPGNRLVFACRSLDYSQPLSSPSLRVPQVRIEGLTDAQVRLFLRSHRPAEADELWTSLAGSAQLELLRSPYFLTLLVEQLDATGALPIGRSALFTGFVRQALRREVERDNPRFDAGELLTERDRLQLARWRWKQPWQLPERGRLLPALSRLAEGMQSSDAGSEQAQVRLEHDDALALLGEPADRAEAILRAGEALALLDEDPAADEVMFVHQLIQEYFAARAFVRRPDVQRLRREGRADEASPPLDAVVDGLDPADPLPPLPPTGWEETLCLAVAMTEQPEALLLPVLDVHPSLAGRAASAPELRRRLSEAVLRTLREALVARSRDPGVDLRERIACADALGALGDPRLLPADEALDGDADEEPALLPSVIELAPADAVLGDDEPIAWAGGHSQAHVPRHRLRIGRLALARFPVTNAEWARFLRAGGYEDPRWWDTAAGRAWQRGESTAAGLHAGVRHWMATFRARPALLEEFYESGAWDETIYRRWRARLALTDAELDAHLAELYPGGVLREPRFWRDARFNAPAQPVVGVCWHEARAYCAWLSDRSGRRYRLPSEAEWEAAARGPEGRVYAWGDELTRFRCNGVESHLRRPAPVGVFPDADTPEGLCDMTGNVWEWTSSAWGRGVETPDYGYPYAADDGRERVDAEADLRRVVRGGSYTDDAGNLKAAFREGLHAASRDGNLGLRLVEAGDA